MISNKCYDNQLKFQSETYTIRSLLQTHFNNHKILPYILTN